MRRVGGSGGRVRGAPAEAGGKKNNTKSPRRSAGGVAPPFYDAPGEVYTGRRRPGGARHPEWETNRRLGSELAFGNLSLSVGPRSGDGKDRRPVRGKGIRPPTGDRHPHGCCSGAFYRGGPPVAQHDSWGKGDGGRGGSQTPDADYSGRRPNRGHPMAVGKGGERTGRGARPLCDWCWGAERSCCRKAKRWGGRGGRKLAQKKRVGRADTKTPRDHAWLQARVTHAGARWLSGGRGGGAPGPRGTGEETAAGPRRRGGTRN